MTDHLSDVDLVMLATCADCDGTRVMPNIFGDYDLCGMCMTLPRDPFV